MENKIALSSLSMDLKRTAIGIHRKSYGMADRFFIEVMKRKTEVDTSKLPPYMQLIMEQIGLLTSRNDEQKSEEALMYSIRIQNYVLYK